MNKGILGVLLTVLGILLTVISLTIVILDSMGFWGYPKEFFEALFWDRGLEPNRFGIQGFQLFYFLLGGIVLSSLGGSFIALAVHAGEKFEFTPWTFSYNILGKKIQNLLPHFEDLHSDLKKGGVKIAFPAYVSFMILISVIVFMVGMTVLFFVWPVILNTTFFSLNNFLLSLMFGGLVGIITLIFVYAYPGMKSKNRKIPIEVNLPYISSFLTLLSSSNVSPRIIFHSIAKVDTLKEVRQEFSNIVRNVEVFGQDLLTSILENSEYTPNEKLKEILNGYVATIRTGGNTTEYLRISTENIMKEKMVKLDLMLESLSAMAEIYIMVLVAMPLLFVVMFATLGMLGGGGEAFNPVLMLYLLLYVGIPILASILIVVVSTFTVW